MRKLVWYFKNNSEVFSVLYEDDTYNLVMNDDTSTFSFGLKRDFGTLYGYPVDWSCLTAKEAIRVLNDLIKLSKKHLAENKALGFDILVADNKHHIMRYQNMIKAIQTI